MLFIDNKDSVFCIMYDAGDSKRLTGRSNPRTKQLTFSVKVLVKVE